MTATYEVSFTVKSGQDFDAELMARILVPYKRDADDVSTAFGVKTVHVFDSTTGALEYVNWDVELEGTLDTALSFCRRLQALFPDLYVPGPSQEQPDDADWYGMFTQDGAEQCAQLLNRAFDRMGFAEVDKLREALEAFVTEREQIGRLPGFGEISDTSVRETLWYRLEVGAKERNYPTDVFNDVYDAVVG